MRRTSSKSHRLGFVASLWMVLLLLGVSACWIVKRRRSQSQTLNVPLLGYSRDEHSATGAKDRLLDDCGYIIVPGLSCPEVWAKPFSMQHYIDFQHVVGGVSVIDLVDHGEGYEIYKLEFAGVFVTLLVSYKDTTSEEEAISMHVTLIDGFDFFDTYHEIWTLKSISLKSDVENEASCRKVELPKTHNKSPFQDAEIGCRLSHSFVAVFSPEAPVTRKQWYMAADEEATKLYSLLVS